jgi:hypothetical protein
MVEAAALHAANLRHEGLALADIARLLNVSEADAERLSIRGGWCPAEWPKMVTRVYGDGTWEVIST